MPPRCTAMPANSAAAEVDAIHRRHRDHQPGRVGRAGGRGCTGHQHVDWNGSAVDAVAAALHDSETLQSLVSPSSSTSSTSGLSGLLSELLTLGLVGLPHVFDVHDRAWEGFCPRRPGSRSEACLDSEYAHLPGFFGIFVGLRRDRAPYGLYADPSERRL